MAEPLTIEQEEGKLFRVVHADGIWLNALNPQRVHLIFFSERASVPTSLTFERDENGAITGETVEKRTGRTGSYRELEVDVVLSLPAVQHIHSVLGKYLEDFTPKVEA